ncbi:hypothetical protein CC80DRAFT_497839 [Byssothecium circinans]|uniref:Uncharacterized protein n=1 Tax=Byssothecium circinans TaxID=147558 RepID=A0A6A5T7S5_9PLEO|nr:hypothetical protein CC80DRAFT_497839 [Byssothecium circinans]
MDSSTCTSLQIFLVASGIAVVLALIVHWINENFNLRWWRRQGSNLRRIVVRQSMDWVNACLGVNWNLLGLRIRQPKLFRVTLPG